MRALLFGLVLMGLFITVPKIHSGSAAFRWETRWTGGITAVTAAWTYGDHCLIVSSRDGVAIIDSGKEIEFGLRYQFRCWDLTTEKEIRGEGRLYDKPLSADPAETVIQAGPLRLGWSYGEAGKGWIYSWPESGTIVQFVRRADFARLDLKRFVRP